MEEMKQLGVGAMNYDLGMVAVPRKILEKKDELTKKELMALRQHTVYGYLLLSQNPLIPATSAAVALQHHELQDGSGYPRGIKGPTGRPIRIFIKEHYPPLCRDRYGRRNLREPHCRPPPRQPRHERTRGD